MVSSGRFVRKRIWLGGCSGTTPETGALLLLLLVLLLLVNSVERAAAGLAGIHYTLH